MGTDDSDAIENRIVIYRISRRLYPHIDRFLQRNSFSISTTVVTILLGITHRKRFCPSSRAMPARGSSFRREPFYLGSGQGRRRVSHAAHRAATINDRRVIKVGQCPSVIITRVISNSAIVVRG